MITFFAIVSGAAYLIGSVPFGFIIGKLHGVDIRKQGSGNIGATNVTRVVGKTQGRICFLLDFLKGALPVVAAAAIAKSHPEVFDAQNAAYLSLAAGVCAVLGHVFPLFLGFKGGKGVATAAGVLFSLAPIPLLIALVLWFVTFITCRYVSLASITAAVAMPIIAGIFMCLDINWPAPIERSTLAVIVLLAALAVYRHRTNIKRLIEGTEGRFGKETPSK